MLFAHLKHILRLDRLRLRGRCGAHDEFLLAATAQNLRKLAKLIPHRRRSWRREATRPSSTFAPAFGDHYPDPSEADFFNTIHPLLPFDIN
jgi:hypothetical protein